MSRRLANVKTRTETGLEYVLQNVLTLTPFGKKCLKEISPFFPGDEELLESEFSKISLIINMLKEESQLKGLLYEQFMDMKDCSFTMERSGNNILSVVELFELKSLLLKMEKISMMQGKYSKLFPKDFLLEDVGELLNVMDPGKNRLNTFYIYDEFSEKLAALRKEKHEKELAVRKEQKKLRSRLEEAYNISISPKFDITVSKTNVEMCEKLEGVAELQMESQDYISITYVLKPTEEIYQVIKSMEGITSDIDDEEEKIREGLSRRISQWKDVLLENCSKIGETDFVLGKASYALEHRCVCPEIIKEHIIEISLGRQLPAEDILISKDKPYCPVNISLYDGVACITGANMGGKTVSLKLAGLVPSLAQYGFFVPCEKAKIGLSNYIHILIGDSQSVQRGLSSFGGEMEELKEILDNSKERALILVDEIASGTNPVEGMALTRSIIDYLEKKPYISLITTHFDMAGLGSDIRNMQVVGLANADFDKLNKELRYADRKERINIISRYMDYRLILVNEEAQIPKDALNIAQMLGIDSEIINRAKEYIQLQNFHRIERR